MPSPQSVGEEIYEDIVQLFPNCRSIVGPQIRSDLRYVAKIFKSRPSFHKYKSGKSAGMWKIPRGWKMNYATLKCLRTKKYLIDTRKETNLRIWSHSKPFRGLISRTELLNHVQFHPSIDIAIPYVTTYYNDTWGFSMRRAEIEELCDGPFEVEVDTESTQDPLELMMVYLPGKSKTEIFFSTYLCHPSMANNELSGPVLTAHLIKWLEGKPRNYSYRFVFGPETIGPICLLNHRRIRRKLLKHHVHAFNVNCVGAGAEWSFLPARNQDDYTAEIVRYVANQLNIKFKEFAYLTRGSDERQYNSPRVGMQMVSIMRSKYHEYSEYHTHLDNLELVSPKILEESFNFYKTLVEFLEADREVAPKTFGEPNVDQVLQQRSIGGQSHLNNQSRRNLMEISQSGLEYYLLQLLMKADLNFQESIELLKSLTDAKAINVNLISKQKLRGKP